MKKTFFLILFILHAIVRSQSILDGYIRHALRENLSLENSKLNYEKSISQKKQAFGYFLPSINFEARYSRADGGRYFDVPIGDLLNPVYTLLNLSLMERNLPPMFPTDLKNQRLYLFREKEREEKIRFLQPIFNLKIFYNYKLQSNLSEAKYFEYELASAELIFETKKAYYNYLKAHKALKAYQAAKKTISEHYNVVKKLYENDKANYGALKAAEAELLNVEAKILEYEKNLNAAKAYFNLILNRDFDADIIIEEDSVLSPQTIFEYDFYYNEAINNRSEFRILSNSKEAISNYKSVAISEFLPSAAFVFDFGYQGEKYRWSKDDRYWMASIVAQWNLFNGFRDRNKIEEIEIESKQIENILEETRRKIALQIRVLYDEFKSELAKFEAYKKKFSAAKIYFDYVSKKYELGSSPQLEFMDAQSKKIIAETEMIVSYYDSLIKKAELEKAAGLDLKKFRNEICGVEK